MWAKTIFIILLAHFFVFNDASKQSIRDMYAKSVNNKQITQNLLQLLATQKQDPFVMGYTGATKMLMAKHALNPIAKLRHFKSGKKILNNAIAMDKTNVELVFLRYATQVSAPSILGYDSDIETDKKFILNNMDKVDDKLAKTIISFMKSQELTPAEKQQLLRIAKW